MTSESLLKLSVVCSKHFGMSVNILTAHIIIEPSEKMLESG